MGFIGEFSKAGIVTDGMNSRVEGQLSIKGGPTIFKTTVTTIATAGAVTYTAAQLLGGLILRDPAGAARADLMPTAALLVAAIKQPYVGATIPFIIRNTADADETITLTTATGVTLTGGGTMTIAQNKLRTFWARITAVTTPAVQVYSLEETF